jgi:membrane protein
MIAAMSQYRRTIQTLREWPWLASYKTLRLRFREDRLGLTAGSLTFTTTIALVPLLTMMLALFSAFPVFGRFRKALESQFLTELVPDAIGKQVLLMLTRFAAKASQLGGLSLVALGVTAMMLMLTMDHTLNAIWRVRERRSIAQRVLVYWAALTLGPLLLGASLSLSSYLASASKGWVDELPGGVGFLLGTMVFVLQTAGFAALYRFVPNTPVRTEHALAGALFVSVGLEVAQKGLALYLSHVPVYSTIYGAFATLPIFLIWIYLSWLIVLLGAVVAAYAPSLLSQVKRWPDVPGQHFQMALAVLKTLADVQHEDVAGYTAWQLAHRLRTDPLQIEPVVEQLVEMGWVARLDEPQSEEGGRHVLLCDPSTTSMAPLLREFLLQPDGWTDLFWQRAGLAQMRLGEALSAPERVLAAKN